MVELRKPYDYDAKKVSDDNALTCKDKHRTDQEFLAEADINYIAERFGLTGEMPQVLELPKYGDFTNVMDFRTANDTIIRAREQFMTLPAKIRARFDNDPQRLIEFMDNADNRQEAEILGLVQKAPEPAKPQEPPVTPAPAAKPAPGA